MEDESKIYSKLLKYFPIKTVELNALAGNDLLELANGSIPLNTSSIQIDLIKKAGYDSIMEIQVPSLKSVYLYDEFAENLRKLIKVLDGLNKNPILFFYIPENPFSSTYNRFNVTIDLLKELLKKESNRLIVYYGESSKVLNMLLYALLGVVKEKSRIKVISKNVGASELPKYFSAAVNSMAKLESERKFGLN